MNKRYTNGNTPEQQQAADRRYREQQRRVRTWVDDVAREAGITKDQLLATSTATLVSALLHNQSK